MNLDNLSLSQLYDRLNDLQGKLLTPEIAWEIADVKDAIDQTETGYL